MKNLLVAFFALSLTSQVYAYYSPDLIFCPSSVTCTKDHDAYSCTYQPDSFQYWAPVEFGSNAEYVFAGIYKFTRADTVTRLNTRSARLRQACKYHKNGAGDGVEILVLPRGDIKLVAYQDNRTNWMPVGERDQPDWVYCEDYPQLCPLTLGEF